MPEHTPSHADHLPRLPGDAKLGLALSGGGFRAALFHVGVLAKMAELDLLRQVQVISTVSGGSIIGAYFYLKVKQLLEGRRQDRLAPSTEAYTQIVREIEVDFLLAVQKNMRMHTFLDQRQNRRMLREGYSPTDRLAELFSRYFFAPLFATDREILMRDIPIRPAPVPDATAGEAQAADSVPLLILNATTLNTGRLWQFTGTWVGEQSPGDDDPMPSLRKLYFDSRELTPKQREKLNRISLGQAVAASCCVPGLFEPVNLTDLYETAEGEELVVRLVDGGLFDNQGLASLFAEGCTHMVCSDASDVLKWQRNPPVRMLNVSMRANEIMMDRIRVGLLEQLFQLGPEQHAFFHMGDEAGKRIFSENAHELVHALSHIRTDLDAFSDLEAYALMYYGYRLSGEKLQAWWTAPDGAGPEQAPVTWRFLGIQDVLADPGRRQQLLMHLEVGSRQLLKVFFLRKTLPYVIVFAPLLIPIGLSALVLYLLPPVPSVVWALLGLVVLSVLAYSQNARISQLIDRVPPLQRLRRRLATALAPLGVPALMGLTVAIVSWIQLRIFDRLFLRYGRLDRGAASVPHERSAKTGRD